MRTVYFYDDEAHEKSAAKAQIDGLVLTIEKTLGAGFKVIVESNARQLRAQFSRLKQKPDLIILDVVNDRPDTQISQNTECGIDLAKFANDKWPNVNVVFLTKLDGASVQRMKAEELSSFRNWVEKNSQSTLTVLTSTLQRLFGREERIRIGRLTLDTKNSTIYWRNFPLAMGRGKELTPATYHFLKVLLSKTREKQLAGKAELAVTYDELRDGEDRDDAAIRTLAHDVRARLKKIEEREYKKSLAHDDVFTNGRDQSYILRDVSEGDSE